MKCSECGSSDWKVNQFMTMFKTNIGPYSGNEAFLRPETAQGMFVEFKRVYGVSREKLPIGLPRYEFKVKNLKSWINKIQEECSKETSEITVSSLKCNVCGTELDLNYEECPICGVQLI